VKAKRSQMGFCLSTMLSILVDGRHVILRRSILSKIKFILNLALDEKNAEHNKIEMEYVLNQLCSSMVQIHEDCQRTLIDLCLSLRRIETIRKRLGAGLRDVLPDLDSSFDTAFDSYNVDNNINLSLEAHLSEVPNEITECLVGSYDLLEFLLLRRSSMFIDKLNTFDPFSTSATPIEQLEILSSFNEKYCLRELIHKFEKS